MENNIKEVELTLATEEEMGPEEKTAAFGEPMEEEELEDLSEDEIFKEEEE